MASAPSLIIELPGYPPQGLPSVPTVIALRALGAIAFADGANIVANSGVTPGDQNGGLFAWSASSTANDDGSSIIKPDGLTPLQAGRWVSVTLPSGKLIAITTGIGPFTLYDEATATTVTGSLRLSGGVLTFVPQ